MDKNDNPDNYIKAIRLINTENGNCTFETGKIPVRQHINVNYFFAQTHVDAYEKIPHPAPRRQFVITLKGKLRFSVSNGESFIIEPGVILIATDTIGTGHTWEIIEGSEWERLYLPLTENAGDYFIKD